MTNARNDDFVRELLYRFGSDGAWAWFGTIEIIAESLTPNRIKGCGKIVKTLCKCTPKYWSEQLYIPMERLKAIYSYINKRKKGRFKVVNGEWWVDVPKVLAFMDEWAQRVHKESRESLPSDSGATPTSRAEQSRTELLATLRRGGGGAGAGGLGLLAEEFTKLTGKAPFHKVRNPEALIDQLKPLVQKRGFDACARVMRERVDECRKRDGKPPSSLRYFVPVFQDDSVFANGSAAPPAPAGPPRRTGEPRDLGAMALGTVEKLPKPEGP